MNFKKILFCLLQIVSLIFAIKFIGFGMEFNDLLLGLLFGIQGDLVYIGMKIDE